LYAKNKNKRNRINLEIRDLRSCTGCMTCEKRSMQFSAEKINIRVITHSLLWRNRKYITQLIARLRRADNDISIPYLISPIGTAIIPIMPNTKYVF
jgi:hypothetical protein